MRRPAVFLNPTKDLTPEESNRLREVIGKYAGKKGTLLPLLTEAQAVCGNWLPANVLAEIADALDVHLSYLYGIATFYTMLSLQPRGRFIIRVCESPACHILGVENLIHVLEDVLGVREGETTPDGLFTLERSSCLGVCEVAPAMQINEVVFGNLTREKIQKVIDDYRAGRTVDYRKLPGSGGRVRKDLDVHRRAVLLHGVGDVDPESIDDYIQIGGYEALKKVLSSMAPEDVVEEVKESGLRGRGGAGFPTGLKWSFTLPIKAPEKYVICNADEGEPGTFKDRYIMEGNPHRLVEGLIIAGYAVGANKGFIYVRGEYYLSMYRLQKAVEQARERGFLGERILGSDFSFDIEIRSGAGAYVCGEETALIESIEGLRGNPRVKPPFPGVRGLWENPTVVNNVETLANVPAILRNGAAWYRSFGTEDSPGVKLYQICGHVNEPQIVEAPLGLTLRELIERYGGGMRDGIPFKMCQTGGASFGFFTAEHLDTVMDYASMQQKGGALGSGTMLVMNERTCVVDVVRNIMHFFQHESCGFCTPCRRGTRVLYDTLTRIAAGDGRETDLDLLIDLARTMSATANCALAMSPIFFVRTTIERLKDEYLAHIVDKACPLGVCPA
jgi:NADH-quinone oxidoreductase subunit F